MKRVVSAKGAHLVDHNAIHVKGVSGPGLMLAAGTAVAKAAQQICIENNIDHVQIFCGKGNNGGDGYVAAIKLKDFGIKKIDVFCFADENDIVGDAAHFFTEMRSVGIDVIFVYNHEDLDFLVKDNTCWIDAIFGTGLNRPVEGYLKNVLNSLSELHSDQIVIAVDIPSGISGTSGKLLGSAIKADMTLTMGFYKSGNFLQEGKAYCGELKLVPLDYPANSLELAEPKIFLCDHELVQDILRPVSITGHKFSAGQVLCVGGSAAMPGAVTLASLAALKGGAGMLRAFAPKAVKPLLLKRLLEAIVSTGKEENILTADDLSDILALQEKSKVMVLGPGIGREPATGKLVRALLKEVSIPLVMDADALFHLTKEDLINKNTELVITPHTGEFARLTNIKTEDVLDDPIARALELATKTQTIVHLKGSTSLTALPSGRVFIHPTGAPGMATAGSGDLLAGLIASFIAQGHKPEEAVLIAVYYHGTAGQAAAEELGNRSMIASDILKHLPMEIKKDEVLA
jgi:ADP-dependent NAD(P)H-hydrate dehydratase / NAD(P)H-hydrate epimerase